MQNQSKRDITFDTQLKTALTGRKCLNVRDTLSFMIVSHGLDQVLIL